MATIASNLVSNGSLNIPAGAITKRGQTFLCGGDYTLTSIWLRLFRFGSPGTVTVELYAIDGSNFPTGPVLSTGSLDSSGFTTLTTGTLYEFTMTTCDLATNTSYAIVVYVSSGDASNYIGWRRQNTDIYSSGGLLYYSGSWTFSTWDHVFTVTGEESAQPPSKAINPSPANAVSTVTLDQATISWEDGGGATSYDVYFGVDAGHLNLVSGDQAGTSFTISGITNGSPFDYITSRAWRIDSKNADGTTTGDVWTFTTITFAAPAPGVRGFSGSGQGSGYGGGAFADKQLNTKTRLIAFAANKVFYEST